LKIPNFLIYINIQTLILVFDDEMGRDHHNTICKYGNRFRGMPVHLLVRGIWYSAIPVMSMNRIYDVCLVEGIVNRDIFADFVDKCLLPCLFLPPYSPDLMPAGFSVRLKVYSSKMFQSRTTP